jgi:hypothetical protein
MTISKTKSNFFALSIVFPLVIGAILLPRGARTVKQNPSQTAQLPQTAEKHRVVNKTKSFRLVKVTRKNDDYIFSFRNDYTRSIDGYSLFTGTKGSRLDVDLTIGDRTIAPGAIEQITLPAANVRSSAAANTSQVSLGILAVMLEDATGDGDPEIITKNQKRRQGRIAQFNHIRLLLKRALRADDSHLSDELQRMKEQISSLPERGEGTENKAFALGLHSAKEELITEMQDAEKDTSRLRHALNDLMNRVDKRLDRMNGKNRNN